MLSLNGLYNSTQALSSPGALVGEFAIFALYLSCTFLA